MRLPVERLTVASISRRASSDVRVDDRFLIALAKNGDRRAHDQIVRRYYGFVRMKASSYFLVGGDHDDLIQEGLVGLYKAVRDFRPDRESSFRNFAELCITRQIITAVKTSTRNKHKPLNGYVSFSRTAATAGDSEPSLEEILPGRPPLIPPPVPSPPRSSARSSLPLHKLSDLESRALALYLDGRSYEEIGERIGCPPKAIDNALQRVKRKVQTTCASARTPSSRPNRRATPGAGTGPRHSAETTKGLQPIRDRLQPLRHARWGQPCRPHLRARRLLAAGCALQRLLDLLLGELRVSASRSGRLLGSLGRLLGVDDEHQRLACGNVGTLA